PAQRPVQTPWQDFAIAEDVVLVALDAEVTSIDLSPDAPIQIARGSVSTDADGSRQATVLFPQGTEATMTLPDGSRQALTTIHVRATEYTVGTNGPKAMPGPLPPTSGYTYAVELSVDEAIAAGAKRVDFNQPLPVYVDNFLDFPVGGVVPVGWYDRDKAAWIPSENGRIIQIVALTNGDADLDTDGDGIADDATKLQALGITDAERAQLATLYSAGRSFWRTPITHFTPWDFNWPYGPPLDGEPPPPPENPRDPPPDEDCDECEGSNINPQAQTVAEVVSLTGTPYTLHYQSRRAPGYKSDKVIDIALAEAGVPASLKGIELSVTVAGHSFTQSFPAAPNQSYRFEWDGVDAYGRLVTGSAPATVTVGYRYNAVYYAARSGFAQSFAQASAGAGTALIGKRGTSTLALTRTWQKELSGYRPAAQALGGWSLGIHHRFDAVHRTLELGTGEHREASDMGAVITTVAGTDVCCHGGDGGPATQATLSRPRAIAVGADGTLYIADTESHRIRRVAPDGVITTVAGTGQRGYDGDGGPAAKAKLYYPYGIALGPDGGLYIADTYNQRIRRVGADGVITTVTGTGQGGYGGDGGPAAQAKLYYPYGIAVGADASLYIADFSNYRIRRVGGADGIITTVAGTGGDEEGYSGDGGPAAQATLSYPFGIAVGPDGNLYIADTSNHRIRRVAPPLTGFSLGEAIIPPPTASRSIASTPKASI
ncbi:MAG: RHS repeat-associated core domain-containing protein, partial [Gammaproteobacteria bacterium]